MPNFILTMGIGILAVIIAVTLIAVFLAGINAIFFAPGTLLAYAGWFFLVTFFLLVAYLAGRDIRGLD